MNKYHLISATLLLSTLTLNPILVTPLNPNSQTKVNSVSYSIASILHNRGIDKDAAEEISNSLVNENEVFFALMIRNLEEECCILSKDEILEYLSTAALHRQDIHFDSYAHLVNMVSKIKQKSLDKKTLTQLGHIAKKNALHIQTVIA